MNYSLKIPAILLDQVHLDLDHPHEFAGERVGFLACKLAEVDGQVVLLGSTYLPVSDGHYLRSAAMGAVISGAAFRVALQFSLKERCSILHVHRHDHLGIPTFSKVDLREYDKFIPDFWKVRPELPHGALLLSRNSAIGRIWSPEPPSPVPLVEIVVVGRTFQVWG
jgi:hypothetical protein